MKVDRQKIHQKYNGHCAYCGKEITVKEMQIDHAEPIMRKSTYQNGKFRQLGECEFPELDCESNMMPSCRKCNNRKWTCGIEDFRSELSKQVMRAEKTCAAFRMALLYKQVEKTEKPIVFYFEIAEPASIKTQFGLLK